MPEAALPAIVLAIIAWIAQQLLGGRPFVVPPELLNAAKSVQINADKLGNAADAVTSWHLAVAVVAGMLFGLALARRRN